jgi:hypothetical protein
VTPGCSRGQPGRYEPCRAAKLDLERTCLGSLHFASLTHTSRQLLVTRCVWNQREVQSNSAKCGRREARIWRPKSHPQSWRRDAQRALTELRDAAAGDTDSHKSAVTARTTVGARARRQPPFLRTWPRMQLETAQKGITRGLVRRNAENVPKASQPASGTWAFASTCAHATFARCGKVAR